MSHFKRIVIGFFVLIAVMLSTLVSSFYFYKGTTEAPADLLTTNIDYKNKTIHDDGSSINTTTIKGSSFDGFVVADLYQGVLETLSSLALYQGMASLVPGLPRREYIKIYAGERKEQIADRLTKQFGWSKNDRKNFLNGFEPINTTNDSYYYPGFYEVESTASSTFVREMLFDKFTSEVSDRYPTTTSEQIPLNTALTVASIIQREAAGKQDMALVSGIIWNRIFAGMNLQVDATLQYAKGKQGNWWPKVLSKDKRIDSAYNTYKNSGLPPSPISNVSLASLQAALNPVKTNCMFYLHDNQHNFHCSETYQGHLDNINTYFK
jgi:UPF0755 protein